MSNVEELLALSNKVLPLIRELDGKLASLKFQAAETSSWEAAVYQAVHSSRRQLEKAHSQMEASK